MELVPTLAALAAVAGLGLAGYVLWGLFVVALAPMTTF
jgi:hypothetical protein